jgi:hypothetical protein
MPFIKINQNHIQLKPSTMEHLNFGIKLHLTLHIVRE